jgi:DNA-binding IclR family transcriptional regulator
LIIAIEHGGLADLEAKHAHLEVVLDQSRRHVEDLERQLAEAREEYSIFAQALQRWQWAIAAAIREEPT